MVIVFSQLRIPLAAYIVLVIIQKGQLISIACQEQDGRQIQFSTENGAKVPFVLEYSYDNSGNLIQASYPDGECVRYDYTRTGRLSQIHTVDEKQFAISYDGKRVKQIEQIADVGTQAHRKTLIEMNQDLKERIRSILISGPTNESLNTQITYQSDENALVTRSISLHILRMRTASPPTGNIHMMQTDESAQL